MVVLLGLDGPQVSPLQKGHGVHGYLSIHHRKCLPIAGLEVVLPGGLNHKVLAGAIGRERQNHMGLPQAPRTLGILAVH